MEGEREGQLKSVRIQRALSGGYGFSLMGGKGTEFPPVICDILDSSPASRCEKISVGDIIVEINGESMSGQTTKQVVTALMKSPDELFLTLKDDDEVRRRLFKFLENLDQPPGFPKGSLMKQRKVVRQDYTGSNSDDVMCITEVTDKNANKNSKKNVMDADATINSVDMTGPTSPPDSGYSTSVSTNGTTESLFSSSSSRRGEGTKTQSHIHLSMEAKGERTNMTGGEVGSIVTTTADVHSEISQSAYLADSEDDVFYDAEGSSVEGNISSNIRQRGDIANGVVVPSETVQDGQCLSNQNSAQCNIEEGAVKRNLVAPSTPPPSPTLSDQNDSMQMNTSEGSENSPFSFEVSAKLQSLQLTEGSLEHDRSLDESKDSSEADLSLESTSSERSSKTLDVPSAKRLAKRLYMQDGFKKSDIAMHLSKKNDFSRLVADEYFSHYTFTGERLDQSLRKFLSNVAVTGETQERERVLYHFAKRYHECNGGLYQSEGAVNTLTCALMLLNTDLHGKKNIGKKMTMNAFITNMEGLNDGGDFPKDTLKAFYQSIKSNPLEWAQDQNDGQTETLPGAKSKARNGSLKVSGAPLLKMEIDSNAPVYMRGYIMRKCVREADGKKRENIIASFKT